MATIREWLIEYDFDHENGVIIYHDTGDWTPGWCSSDEIKQRCIIKWDSNILDLEFDDGFGGPECPRFVAKDNKCIYFPDQYDGATNLCVVYHNIEYYLSDGSATPYAGS